MNKRTELQKQYASWLKAATHTLAMTSCEKAQEEPFLSVYWGIKKHFEDSIRREIQLNS